MKRLDWRRWISLASFALAPVAVFIVVRAIEDVTLARAIASLQHVDLQQLLLAALYTAASYATLTAFDWLGTRYAGSDLRYRRVALASFLGLSIGHTVGFAPFSSGAIRYRYYTRWGLSLSQIALIVLFSAATVTVGEIGLAAVALLGQPGFAQKLLASDSIALTLLLGAICAMLILGYLGLCFSGRRSFRLFRWRVSVPSPRLALLQVAAGLVNYGLVTLALQVLLSASAPISFFATATAYILASVAALLSHIPGGIGILEATITLLLPSQDVLGPLIAFRFVYYFAPLGLGLVVLAATELWERVGVSR